MGNYYLPNTKRKIPLHPLCLNQEVLDSPGNHKEIEILPRTDIKILTYNLFLRPIVSNNGDDYKNERLVDFFEHLKDYDVICLQEVFGMLNNRKAMLLDEATRHGFYFYAESKAPKFSTLTIIDGGLLILSRFKIVVSDFIPFSCGVHADSFCQKGVLYAQIQVKDSNFHVFTTHTQASYVAGSDYFWKVAFDVRMQQIDELALYVGNLLDKYMKNPGERIFILGDLNVNALTSNVKLPSSIPKETILQEYNSVLNKLQSNCLECEDLYVKYHKKNSITFAETFPDGTFENVLTDKPDWGMEYCLDYIFEAKFKQYKPDTKISIKYDSIRVERFFVDQSEFKNGKKKYIQLSDHYGLVVHLTYTKINTQKDGN